MENETADIEAEIIEPEQEIEDIAAESESTDSQEVPEESAESADEVVVSIGEESPPQEQEKAPEWVRELRRKHREATRENQELRARLETAKPVTTVPAKPTIESCDYDADVFEQRFSAWSEAKRIADAEAEKAEAAKREQSKAWNDTLTQFVEAKKATKIRGYEDAEDAVKEVLSEVQQNILVGTFDAQTAVNLIAVLGANQKRARELAAITDPLKYVRELTKLEGQVKVTARKPATAPERTVKSGSAPIGGSSEAILARLEEEADRTGDRTKVAAYRRKLRESNT
jgi:hypothetical protein